MFTEFAESAQQRGVDVNSQVVLGFVGLKDRLQHRYSERQYKLTQIAKYGAAARLGQLRHGTDGRTDGSRYCLMPTAGAYQVAAVLTAKDRTAAATCRITLIHARYSLYFTTGLQIRDGHGLGPSMGWVGLG